MFFSWIYVIIHILSQMAMHSRGRYTEKQLERCSKLTGGFGRDMAKAFDNLVESQSARMSTPSAKTYEILKGDCRLFFQRFKDDKFFEHTPGRQVANMPAIDSTCRIKTPYLLGRYLSTGCGKIDRLSRYNHATRHRQANIMWILFVIMLSQTGCVLIPSVSVSHTQILGADVRLMKTI